MASPKPKAKYGYNPEPRLSANQVAEYLTASPTRRKSIIKDARFPRTVVVARYDGVRTAISKFLADPMRKTSILSDALPDLSARENKPGASTWTKDDCRLSAEAVIAFQKNQGQMGLGKMDFRAVVSKQPKLLINSVEISVSIDVTVHRPNKDGTQSAGGVVTLLSKSEQSTTARTERCRTSSVLAAMFAGQHLTYLGIPDAKLCYALDVFSGSLIRAPSTYKQKADNIAESCEEIALRWTTIQPPSDYDGPNF